MQVPFAEAINPMVEKGDTRKTLEGLYVGNFGPGKFSRYTASIVEGGFLVTL
jgi:hypothetical protein